MSAASRASPPGPPGTDQTGPLASHRKSSLFAGAQVPAGLRAFGADGGGRRAVGHQPRQGEHRSEGRQGDAAVDAGVGGEQQQHGADQRECHKPGAPPAQQHDHRQDARRQRQMRQVRRDREGAEQRRRCPFRPSLFRRMQAVAEGQREQAQHGGRGEDVRHQQGCEPGCGGTGRKRGADCQMAQRRGTVQHPGGQPQQI